MIQVSVLIRGTPEPVIMTLPVKPCQGDTLLVAGHNVLEVVNVTFRANDATLCVNAKEKY